MPGRREAVREKAQQVHVQQSRARIARRVALITGAVAAVAVVAVVVSWTISGAVSRPQLTPKSADDGGFAVTAITGSAALGSLAEVATPTPTAEPEVQGDETPTPTPTTTAPVEIHVYVDYLSPTAREWQLANSAQLSTWVTDGAVTLTYHPVAMLTAKSNGTKYSLRAASAAACVATYAPDSFFAFNADLLERQPSIDSDGLSDKMLADLAQANGGDDLTRLRDCIETEAFASWVKTSTESAVAGIDGTDGLALTGNSLVTVNGQAYVGASDDPAEFSQFVLTTASGKSAKAQSATPTPTASVTP
ncbi:MAG: protein-disulfide isomerase [Microbacterium sp. SCN 70-200]|nr:MAG: protein-disulfide isomerase [Microbacterium sp. SCN 70-200]OJV79270.1 MAG: protein-disulfide isomerase [Microbacterium sp. 70-16]